MPQIAQQDYIRINVSSEDFNKTLSGEALTAVKNAVANKTIHDVIFCITDSDSKVVAEVKVLCVDFDNLLVYFNYGTSSYYMSYDA